jgi:hypothetical protein
MITNFSENFAASIFIVEEGSGRFLRNRGTHSQGCGVCLEEHNLIKIVCYTRLNKRTNFIKQNISGGGEPTVTQALKISPALYGTGT